MMRTVVSETKQSHDLAQLALMTRGSALISAPTLPADDTATPASGNFLQLIVRQKKIIGASLAAALVVAAVYLIVTRPTYRSVSTLWVQQTGPRILNELAAVSNDNSPYLHTQCEVIKSESVLDAVLADPGLNARCSVLPGDKLDYLQKHVTAEPDKLGDIINVTTEAPAASLAAAIGNAVVTQYVDFEQQQQRSTNLRVIDLLQNERKELTQTLQTTRGQMSQFHQANSDLPTSGLEKTVQGDQLPAVAQALTAAQIEAIDSQAMLDALHSDPKTMVEVIQSGQSTDSSAAASPSRNLRDEYRQRQQALQSMISTYGPEHPAVLSMQASMAGLTAAIDHADRVTVESCETRAREAQTKLAQLNDWSESVRRNAVSTDSKVDQYAQLEASAAQVERALERLDDRTQELRATQDSGGLNVSVLRQAEPDEKPVSPKRTQTLGMAIVVGLMLGMAGALTADWLDQRVRFGEATESSMGLKVLGMIPDAPGDERLPQMPYGRAREVEMHPGSFMSESFRGVRTSIRYTMGGTSQPVLLVTSAGVHEGKTTVAANLAIATAAAGARVLLVDADCRRPSLHKVFETHNDFGLSDVLTRQVALGMVTQSTATANLDLVASGPVTINPAEMFHSVAFERFIEEVASTYDQVIFDSPPASAFADARLIAAVADATILVVRDEQSTRSQVIHARQSLQSVGANLIGVVLNGTRRLHGAQVYDSYGEGGESRIMLGKMDGKQPDEESGNALSPPRLAVNGGLNGSVNGSVNGEGHSSAAG